MFEQINKNIIEILGINNLPKEIQEQALERLGSIVYQAIIVRALTLMEEKDQDKFQELLDQDSDPDTLFSYLNEKVGDIESIAYEEANNFKEENSEPQSL
jgi:hypothetical protein